MGEKVFVYGTLRTGDVRFNMQGFLEVLHEEAYLPGYDMFTNGGFPGIVRGKGTVRGEIHRYATLEVLDMIEGHREEYPDSSFYQRQMVEIEIPGDESTEAWVYVLHYGGAAKERVKEMSRIASGDWFEHKGLYRKAI